MRTVMIFIKSLKLTWIRGHLTTNSSLIGIFSEIYGCHAKKQLRYYVTLGLNIVDKGQRPLVL